jgi:hypothetical protein
LAQRLVLANQVIALRLHFLHLVVVLGEGSIKFGLQHGGVDIRVVPDLSGSGDKSDLVVVDPHDPTTTSKLEAPMQLLNQLPMVTNFAGARSV